MADGPGAQAAECRRLTADALVERVRRGVVGDGRLLPGPFGPRRVTHADWTASGRALDFVEDASRDQVLPLYANTHTESSATGRHTTRLREQARQVIHQAVGGTDQDLVIFSGSGATTAVAKLAGLLELGRWAAGPGPRPVVLVGPFEHHTNLLPWRESAAEVVAVGEDADGQLDLAGLEAQLIRHAGRPLVVRRDLARNRVPTVPGGSTVAFVDPVGHRYLDDPVAREEGGTPGIVESIRAGLVVALKQAVGTDLIHAREQRFLRRAVRAPAARHRPRPVDLLGRHGHRLLGDYAFDPRTGHRRHHRAPPDEALSLAGLLAGRAELAPARAGAAARLLLPPLPA